MGDVLVVCGLQAEGRIARGAGVRVVAGGGRHDLLVSTIDAAIDAIDAIDAGDAGVAGLVSFGVAGGLAPSATPGTLVVADAVVTAGEIAFTDARWSAALCDRLPAATVAAIAGSDAIAQSVPHKASLARATGAVAVDMESHVVARAALRRGLPFVVVRAVADPCDRALPPAAAVAMRPDGGVDLVAVLRSLAASPRQLAALVATARDARAATAALRGARRAVGERFGRDA